MHSYMCYSNSLDYDHMCDKVYTSVNSHCIIASLRPHFSAFFQLNYFSNYTSKMYLLSNKHLSSQVLKVALMRFKLPLGH